MAVMRFRTLIVTAAAVAAVVVPRLSRAADVILDHLPPGAIKLDGKILKEWPGTTPSSETIKAGKASATFVAGYDDQGIWVGAEVIKDGSVHRTSAFGPNEDCVSLIIGFPGNGVGKGGVESVYEVGVYAGVPGSSSGLVKFRSGSGKPIDGAKIVEAPRKGGGYSVEAFIPWSSFPEGKKVRAGLRGALRVYDSDGSSIRAIKATGPGSVESPGALGFLLIEPEQSLPPALASKKQTLRDVTFDVSADFTGDAVNERALFIGRSLYVLGPGFKEGKQWLALDLGADVAAVDTRDATGDGKQELVITTRAKASGVTREAVTLWSFLGGVPTRVFGHETLVESGSNTLRDVITYGSGKKPTITVAYEKAKGYTVDSYKEPIASDVDPILWPWGTVRERTFAWNGSAFVKDKEVAQKGIAPTAIAEPPTVKAPNSEVLPPPSDLVAAAFKQYKKDKGLAPDAMARFEASASVLPGKKGRVGLYGKDLVIATGDGGYAIVAMSRFAQDKDVIEITCRDLTGDGRDEIIVRGILRAKLTGPGAADKEVLREVMFIYSPKGQAAPKGSASGAGSGLAITPVFGVETSRAMGKDLVEANFRIITAKGSTTGKIELMKGSTKGFSKSNWPFGAETPTPGIEPLLLPWGSETAVTYSWNGEKFTR